MADNARMFRRSLLKILGVGAVTATVAPAVIHRLAVPEEVVEPVRTYFLPPRGGWQYTNLWQMSGRYVGGPQQYGPILFYYGDVYAYESGLGERGFQLHQTVQQRLEMGEQIRAYNDTLLAKLFEPADYGNWAIPFGSTINFPNYASLTASADARSSES
jgi:hypothetical protein